VQTLVILIFVRFCIECFNKIYQFHYVLYDFPLSSHNVGLLNVDNSSKTTGVFDFVSNLMCQVINPNVDIDGVLSRVKWQVFRVTEKRKN